MALFAPSIQTVLCTFINKKLALLFLYLAFCTFLHTMLLITALCGVVEGRLGAIYLTNFSGLVQYLSTAPRQDCLQALTLSGFRVRTVQIGQAHLTPPAVPPPPLLLCATSPSTPRNVASDK